MPPKHTEKEITESLMAMIAWAGNANAASRALKAKGISVSGTTLTQWTREKYYDRYDKMREQYAAQLEGQLAHEYRDIARLAVEVEREALEYMREYMKSGKERDPSRAAANAATVAAKMTDKVMSLTGRPTQIVETRNTEEILRSLAAKGVFQLPEASVVEDQTDPPT